MGIAERREEERRQLHNLIAETAMSIYLEEGLEQLSIRNIAKRIDYSPTTIYLYFKDKDHLFLEMHDRAFGRLLERFQAVASIEDPEERLLRMGEAYISFGLENPELYELIFMHKAPMQVLLEDDCHEWTQGKRVFEQLHLTVQQCIAEGKAPNHPSELLSISIWSHVHGLVSLANRDRLLVKVPQEQVRATLHAALKGQMDMLHAAAKYERIQGLLS